MKTRIQQLLTTAIKSTRAAIDLASIMVGIIVIGIIGGVIAATVFAVIPWAQDNAAKAELDSVATAQSAFKGFKSEKGNAHYGSMEELRNYPKGALISGDSAAEVTDNAADCFVAVSRSASGAQFFSTNKTGSPEKVTADNPLPTCENGETTAPTDDAANPEVLMNWFQTYGSNYAAFDIRVALPNEAFSSITSLNTPMYTTWIDENGFVNTNWYPSTRETVFPDTQNVSPGALSWSFIDANGNTILEGNEEAMNMNGYYASSDGISSAYVPGTEGHFTVTASIPEGRTLAQWQAFFNENNPSSFVLNIGDERIIMPLKDGLYVSDTSTPPSNYYN